MTGPTRAGCSLPTERAADDVTARIDGRTDDASDATRATLQMQLDRDIGEVTWTHVDASGPAEDSAEAWSIRYAR